ncbi:MAG: archaeosine biosynthesis radical SAM protein RaSEA [Candidatus Heimdallarchaeaceae archaeon]
MKINPSLAHILYGFRQSYLPKRSQSRRVVAWEEDHRLRSGPAKALVFILPTKGCSWALSHSGGCSICGYIYDNPKETNFDELFSDLANKLSSLIKKGQDYSVKLFTSGSILDSKEVPDDILVNILNELEKYGDQIKEVVLESRPSFISEKKLAIIQKNFDMSKIEIAIGLESANDKILQNSINKGFLWEDFEEATKRIISYGGNVKVYLLFKPPFVSEYDSIIDIFQSVEKIVKLGVDTVSINAINIQRGTFLSSLFERKQYRPPYLWSLVHLCTEIKNKYPHLRIICDPVAGGKEKGAHNCGECDTQIVKSLKDFTLTQDTVVFESLKDCSCKNEWYSHLVHRKLSINDYSYI